MFLLDACDDGGVDTGHDDRVEELLVDGELLFLFPLASLAGVALLDVHALLCLLVFEAEK